MQLIDDFGKVYTVKDLNAFNQHLVKYHSMNGKGDGSLHEENGYWFTVSVAFFDSVMSS